MPQKKYRYTTSSGKTYEVIKDEDGNTIGSPVEISNMGISPQSELKSTNWEDKFRNYIAPILSGASTYGPAVAGMSLSGVGGPAVGAGAGLLGGMGGNIGFQALQDLWPRGLGASPIARGEDPIIQAALETGGQVIGGKAIENLGSALNYLRNTSLSPVGLKDRILNSLGEKFFSATARNKSPNYAAEFGPALDSPYVKNIPINIGQATGETLPSLLAGSAYKKQEKDFVFKQAKAQQESVNKMLTDFAKGERTTFQTSEAELAGRMARNIEAEFQPAKAEVKTLHNAAEGYLQSTGSPGLGRPEPSRIIAGGVYRPPVVLHGPIQLNHTSALIDNLDTQLAMELKSGAEKGGLSETARNAISRMRDVLGTYKNTATDMQGNPTIDYVTAKNSRAQLYDSIETLRLETPNFASRMGGEMTAIGKALSKDMDESVNSWTDPVAKSLVQRAKNATIRMHERFDSGISNEFRDAITDINLDATKVAGTVLNGTEEQIAKYVASSRDTSALETAMAQKIFQKSFMNNGKFNGETAMSVFNDYLPKMKMFTTADTRQQLKYAINAFRLMQKEGMPGETSLMLRAGYAGFLLSGATLSGLMSYARGGNAGDIGLSAGATGAGLLLGSVALLKSPQFARLFFNRDFARSLVDLSRTPPTSPQASALTKRVFKFMDGVRMSLQGKMFIVEDGKLVPEDKSTEPQATSSPKSPDLFQ